MAVTVSFRIQIIDATLTMFELMHWHVAYILIRLETQVLLTCRQIVASIVNLCGEQLWSERPAQLSSNSLDHGLK